MEIVNFENSKKFEHKTATIFEYNTKDKDINFCFCNINGRYPIKGYAINKHCKELAFVISGNGTINVNQKNYNLNQNDVVLINKGEKFFWQGKLTLALPCSPAWNTSQYEIVEN